MLEPERTESALTAIVDYGANFARFLLFTQWITRHLLPPPAVAAATTVRIQSSHCTKIPLQNHIPGPRSEAVDPSGSHL